MFPGFGWAQPNHHAGSADYLAVDSILEEPMVHEVPLRIAVVRPPLGVRWAVQSGREDLIEPSERSEAMIAFDLSVRIGAPEATARPVPVGIVEPRCRSKGSPGN
jgi:hypothetical protein